VAQVEKIQEMAQIQFLALLLLMVVVVVETLLEQVKMVALAAVEQV
jgi:hypothetical protein